MTNYIDFYDVESINKKLDVCDILSGRSEDKYWSNATRSLLYAVCLYINNTTPKEDHTFENVLSVIIHSNSANIRHFFNYIIEDEEAKTAFKDTVDKYGEVTLDSIIISASIKVETYLYFMR